MADLSSFNRLPWYYQGLIVLGIAAVLLGGFWYQLLSPIQTAIDAQMAELSGLNLEIAAAVQRQQELAQIRAESEQLQQRLNALKSVLPLERETDEILRQVQQAATDSSLRIVRVSPRATVENAAYEAWPIEMEVEATYHNMGLYLDQIRNLDRIVNITDLAMGNGGDGVTTTVSATFTATTFVYVEEDPLPGN